MRTYKLDSTFVLNYATAATNIENNGILKNKKIKGNWEEK